MAGDSKLDDALRDLAAARAELVALKRKHEIEIRRLERQYAASQGDGAILRVRLADVERRNTR